MKRRRTMMLFFWGALLAMAIAIPTNDRRVSVEVWFSVFAIWAMGAVIVQLLFVVPMKSTSNISVWRWLSSLMRGDNTLTSGSLLGPRATQNLLQRSYVSDPTFSRDLRPRLQELTNYYLPISHGVDPTRSADRTRAALGPLYWLIDNSAKDRRPTPRDIEQFLSVVVDGSAENSADSRGETGSATFVVGDN